MYYQYFRPLNYLCNVFGVSKPHINSEGQSVSTILIVKIWCLIIGALFIASFCLTITVTEFNLKKSLEVISDINGLVMNTIVILLNLLNSIKVYVSIHKTYNVIFNDFNFDNTTLKLFAIKMYFWFSIPTIIFIILIIMEILSHHIPYALLIKIPMFLSLMHLYMHLYLNLALLKVLNTILSKTLIYDDKILHIEDFERKSNVLYVLSPTVKFFDYNNHIHFDIKLFCKIYDNLSTSVHLLEEIHGIAVLLSIWVMFTSGVVGLTLIVCNQASIKWLAYAESILPYFWGFIGCSISEKMRGEVDQTIMLIIKGLIDYRCHPAIKPTLEMFKQLVSNDRLQFTACSLFRLSYAMLLGTLLNVLTYSIILIQMFWNEG